MFALRERAAIFGRPQRRFERISKARAQVWRVALLGIPTRKSLRILVVFQLPPSIGVGRFARRFFVDEVFGGNAL